MTDFPIYIPRRGAGRQNDTSAVYLDIVAQRISEIDPAITCMDIPGERTVLYNGADTGVSFIVADDQMNILVMKMRGGKRYIAYWGLVYEAYRTIEYILCEDGVIS